MNPVPYKKFEKLIMSTLVHLENLPEELLIIIIKLLDFKSVFNLYQTCYRMQNVIKMPGVLKVCNLSHSTLATIKTMQQNIVKDISAHLYELNVSGLLDLTATSLISAVKKMKSLKILNMSYTNITLDDFLDIYKVCPTIEKISINLLFKDPKKLFSQCKETLHMCQEVFQKLTDVHFIVRFDFARNFSILNDNPMNILQSSSKNNLKFTIYNWAFTYYMKNISEIGFDHLAVFISPTNPISCHWANYEAFDPLLKSEKFEYIVILHNIKTSIWITPLFENFFNENFNISKWKFVTLNICKPEEIIEGNYSIFFWSKEKIKFDNTFFSHLKNKIMKILPYYMHIKAEDLCEADLSNIDIKKIEWCRIYQFLPESKSIRGDDCSEPNFKKRRIVKPSIILNYDNIFCDQKTVKLSIIFPVSGIVSLTSSSDYLRKLTYLSLEGDYVMYSNEFFNILLRCCENLTTLNVEASSVCRCCQAIVRSIPLSRSLKNIRLIDKRIDFNTLFLSFSQCTTLENIYIVDSSSEFSTINDPTPMFKKCINLYSLYIRGQMSATKMKTFTKILNVAKKRCSLDHLNIILQIPSNKCDIFNPYMKVFALNTIKQK